jgi:hypothetical protein
MIFSILKSGKTGILFLTEQNNHVDDNGVQANDNISTYFVLDRKQEN